MNSDYYRYWGKSDKGGAYHLLPYHGLDVAAVGWVLLEQSPNIRNFFESCYGLSGEGPASITWQIRGL